MAAPNNADDDQCILFLCYIGDPAGECTVPSLLRAHQTVGVGIIS